MEVGVLREADRVAGSERCDAVVLQPGPVVTAVGGGVQPRADARVAAAQRLAVVIPHRREQLVRVGRVHDQVGGTVKSVAPASTLVQVVPPSVER